MTNLENDGTHVPHDLAGLVEADHQTVLVHECDGNDRPELVGRVNALDCFDTNQLAELKRHDQNIVFEVSRRRRVFLLSTSVGERRSS